MNMIATIKNFLQKNIASSPGKPSSEAYDNWSASYDQQPGNLMLHLDEHLFAQLISSMDLANKKVVDIGCGTGRHWAKMQALHPGLLIGFDVSAGMLEQLKRKFPDAVTWLVEDNRLTMVADQFADCIITTLTIAHIKNITEAIAAWSRILKQNGDLLITDFHPAILAKGGKRSFTYQGETISVTNYVHALHTVETIFKKHGFIILEKEERYIDETVKHFYEAQNALPVYERFKGMPVIYGLRLKKDHAPQ